MSVHPPVQPRYPVLRRLFFSSRGQNKRRQNDEPPLQLSGQDPSVWEASLYEYMSQLNEKDRQYVLRIGLSPDLNGEAMNQYSRSLTGSYSQRRSTKVLAAVQPIAAAIKSFARVIDAMVSSNPQVAGLMCMKPIQIHEKIVAMLETLSVYLPLFETWRRLFPKESFTDLSNRMRITCVRFVAFLVQAIKFLRRNTASNMLLSIVLPSLETRFTDAEQDIKRQTDHLRIQIQTAEAESAQARHLVIHDMLRTATGNMERQRAKPTVTLPFRYIHHCIRNPKFFGREAELTDLHAKLAPGRVDHPDSSTELCSVVLYGMGGLGKSSIAIEYMYRYFDTYDVIIWMFADKQDKLEAQFVQLARFLGLIVDDGRTDKAHEDVLHWIANCDVNWLFVLDNADDMSILAPFWPAAKHGAMIITSRNPHYTGQGSFATAGIAIRSFGVQEGAQFLLRGLAIDDDPTDSDKEAATTISGLFDGLPLSLRQASCFMKSKGCLPRAYLDVWAQRRDALERTPIPGYTKTMADVWEMSMGTLSQDALDVLDLLTVMDPDAIPTELFRKHGHLATFTGALGDPLRYLDAVEGLANQSLVESKDLGDILSLHRFFQDSTFDKLKSRPDRCSEVYRSVLSMVSRAVPTDDYLSMKHLDAWQVVEMYIPHLEQLHRRALHVDVMPPAALDFLLSISGRVAGYYHETGRYALGEHLLIQAENLASEHAEEVSAEMLAKVYYYHGRMCQEMNQPIGAVENLEKAISLWESIEEAPDLGPGEEAFPAILYENLGMSCIGASRFDEAKDALQKAIDLAHLPDAPSHQVLGDFMQCMAACHLHEGDVDAAEDMGRRALLERCGENNENRGGALYTLGNVYLRQRKYDEALELHQEVLELYTKDLGNMHHWVADSCHKVGCILAIPEFGRGDLAQAEEFLRKSLHIWTAPNDSGNAHSARSMARTKWKLANVLRLADPESQEAQQLHAEAREVVMDQLGLDLDASDTDAQGEIVDNLVWYWSR
ncbi:hypothetical protein QBC46DRAFT_350391 [Diplogelasinospora grovesii]|uniref:NB-ARC domain-containing protein n=1 Tax=Diplogelasinospora grovesii TaxID=303347 RepID=A0AAN6NIG1_9PEZI|nr:hypothetical protein QBC46DRAFT_350391 [Diplogelasinospora grovesii]